MMSVLDHLIPDDFFSNYKLKNKVGRENYLINTLTVNIRKKMNNPDVKSQLHLLGIEQNRSSSSYEMYFYNLRAVYEELIALQGTTNINNNTEFGRAIISSLPSIIDFCTALISPISNYNLCLCENYNLFEINETNKSNESNYWEETLSKMGQHSKEQLTNRQEVVDYTDSNNKNNFMLSKAFSLPLEKCFHFNSQQHSTTEMDKFSKCDKPTTYHELYARRRLQHYNTNLQQITTFACLTIKNNFKVETIIENYDEWRNKVDTVKNLFVRAFSKNNDEETNSISLLDGLFDISAEINVSPPLQKLYQEYISNPKNLPSNEGNHNLGHAIRNLDEHREKFMNYINRINEIFYISVKSKLTMLETADNQRKFSADVVIHKNSSQEYIHYHLNNRLTLFDLSGKHQMVNSLTDIRKPLTTITRILHIDHNKDASNEGKAYNILGNSLFQLLKMCFRNFKAFPVLYTMFTEWFVDSMSSKRKRFEVTTNADSAHKYWRRHMKIYLR